MRPSIISTLMDVAHVWSKRGTCPRLQVGAVVATSDGVILSSGYNGSPVGMPHCKHPCTCGHEFSTEPGYFHLQGECEFTKQCRTAVHAEANTISRAARQGVCLKDSVMVTTHATCLACAMLIVQAGISEVWYEVPYRATEGLELLTLARVKVQHYRKS